MVSTNEVSIQSDLVSNYTPNCRLRCQKMLILLSVNYMDDSNCPLDELYSEGNQQMKHNGSLKHAGNQRALKNMRKGKHPGQSGQICNAQKSCC